MTKNQKMLLGIGLVGVGGYLLWKQNKDKVFANASGKPIFKPTTSTGPFIPESSRVFSNAAGKFCPSGTTWSSSQGKCVSWTSMGSTSMGSTSKSGIFRPVGAGGRPIPTGTGPFKPTTSTGPFI